MDSDATKMSQFLRDELNERTSVYTNIKIPQSTQNQMKQKGEYGGINGDVLERFNKELSLISSDFFDLDSISQSLMEDLELLLDFLISQYSEGKSNEESSSEGLIEPAKNLHRRNKKKISSTAKSNDAIGEVYLEFFINGLSNFFTKLYNSTTYEDWPLDIQKRCLKCSDKLVKLIVIQISSDCLPLLKLLNLIFNVDLPFYSDKMKNMETATNCLPLLVLNHLLNYFGEVGGFEMLRERFEKEKELSFEIGSLLLLPFVKCFKYLSNSTVDQCFKPIMHILWKGFEDDITFSKPSSFIECFEYAYISSDVFESHIMPIIEVICIISKNITEEKVKNEVTVICVKAVTGIFVSFTSQSDDETIGEMKSNLINVKQSLILDLLKFPSFKLNGLIAMNKLTEKVNNFDFFDWCFKNNIVKSALVYFPALLIPQYWKELSKIIVFLTKTGYDFDRIHFRDNASYKIDEMLCDILDVLNEKKNFVIIDGIVSLLVHVIPHLSSEQKNVLNEKGFHI